MTCGLFLILHHVLCVLAIDPGTSTECTETPVCEEPGRYICDVLLHSLCFHFRDLVSCLTWSRHLCNFCCCYAEFAGIWWIMRLCSDYDELYIWFFSFIFVFLSKFLHVLCCRILLWPSNSLQLQEGALCLIVGSAPWCLAWVTETWD